MVSPYRAHSEVHDPMLDMVFQAASDNDLPRLKSLVVMLDLGRGRPKKVIEDLRVEDDPKLEGFSALHIAARGSLEVCRYLVEELLVDVDLVDKEGQVSRYPTVLCFLWVWHRVIENTSVFATYCNGGTAEYLLDHGANPDKADNNGGFLLHYAAEIGSCEMVELLLAKGAYVDPVCACGTPLHIAAGGAQYGAMKILLDHSADYNKMVDGVTPLMAAKDANSTECIKLLVKAMQLDPGDAVLLSDRSLCWLHMGYGRKALLDANQCRKMRPLWPKACRRQGEALMLLKDYEGASERFLDGLKLDPVDTAIEDALREAMKSLMTSRSTKAN
ncbi:hypothetical protein ZWY2020_053872 [Hordeum vulgare]|nr:hypothetical protein ZWY2020_053872 [Hordeum vulgare]